MPKIVKKDDGRMTEIIIKVDDIFLEQAKIKGMEDRYELIRCKDCKYYSGKWCKRNAITDFDLNDVMKSADDYCSQAERKEEFDCNDCYYSMQNCKDISICCEDETALCDDFKPVAERKEE